MKQVTLGTFVTPEMLEKVLEIRQQSSSTLTQAERIDREVIAPNLETINKKVGQENDSRFLAYAIIHALDSMGA